MRWRCLAPLGGAATQPPPAAARHALAPHPTRPPSAVFACSWYNQKRVQLLLLAGMTALLVIVLAGAPCHWEALLPPLTPALFGAILPN